MRDSWRDTSLEICCDIEMPLRSFVEAESFSRSGGVDISDRLRDGVFSCPSEGVRDLAGSWCCELKAEDGSMAWGWMGRMLTEIVEGWVNGNGG
jgi:hypothetical protein